MATCESTLIPLGAILPSPRGRPAVVDAVNKFRADNLDGSFAASFGGRHPNGGEVPLSIHDPHVDLLAFGYYNWPQQRMGPQESSPHIDLTQDLALRDSLRARIKEIAAQNKIRVLLPFVDEASVVGVIEYNSSIVGGENVLAIDSSAAETYWDKRDRDRVRAVVTDAEATEVEVVHQADMLQAIDWKKLRLDGVLPMPKKGDTETDEQYECRLNAPPGRGKGLTIFAGLLSLYAKDQEARLLKEQGQSFDPHNILEDDVIILFHDTDIVNPHQYDATTHVLGFPLAYPSYIRAGQDGTYNYRSGQIARMGAGRNNYPVASEANLLSNLFTNDLDDMNSQTNHLSEQIGLALQTLRWQLSGEWWMRWGDMKTMIGCNGMGIETIKNVICASHSIQDGIETRCQVADIQPKNEDKPADMENEWNMIYSLAQLIRKLAIYIDYVKKFPDEWTITDVASYNVRAGGKLTYNIVPDKQSYQSDWPVHNTVPRMRALDVLLPSINELRDYGYVDMGKFWN